MGLLDGNMQPIAACLAYLARHNVYDGLLQRIDTGKGRKRARAAKEPTAQFDKRMTELKCDDQQQHAAYAFMRSTLRHSVDLFAFVDMCKRVACALNETTGRPMLLRCSHLQQCRGVTAPACATGTSIVACPSSNCCSTACPGR